MGEFTVKSITKEKFLSLLKIIKECENYGHFLAINMLSTRYVYNQKEYPLTKEEYLKYVKKYKVN